MRFYFDKMLKMLMGHGEALDPLDDIHDIHRR